MSGAIATCFLSTHLIRTPEAIAPHAVAVPCAMASVTFSHVEAVAALAFHHLLSDFRYTMFPAERISPASHPTTILFTFALPVASARTCP